jgi:hypothetical protein
MGKRSPWLNRARTSEAADIADKRIKFRERHPEFEGSIDRLLRVQEQFTHPNDYGRTWEERYERAWKLLLNNAEAKRLFEKNPKKQKLE